MPEDTTTTSLKALFAFPFEGPDWQSRSAVGAGLVLAESLIGVMFGVASTVVPLLFCLTPFLLVAQAVPLVFLAGYALRIMRQAIDGEEVALPAWDGWGKLGAEGLRGGLVTLAYLAPAIVAYVAGLGLYMAGVYAAVPYSYDTRYGAVAGLVPLFGALAVFFVAIGISMLLLLVGGIPLPAALAHYAARGRLSAAFHVREWWPILRANPLGYLLSWAMVAGLLTIGYYAYMITVYSGILCCLAPFVLAPAWYYLVVVGAALFGRTYRESLTALAARAPAGAGPA